MERTAAVEFRAAGRTLSGRLITYGEVAQGRAEMFAPGARASFADPLELDLQHDPAIIAASTADGSLSVSSGAGGVELRATLPDAQQGDPGSAPLEMVRRGAVRGFSAAFHALEEHRASGLRVITRYHVVRAGLVDEPEYAGSRVELRARMGRTLTASVPTGRRLACDCSGSARFAQLEDEMADAINEAIGRAIAEAEGNDVIAAWGNYSNPLASAKTGTLRTAVDGDGVRVDIDLPDDAAGRAVIAAQESAGVVVRPYIDEFGVNRYEMPDGTVVYSPKEGEPPIRAFIVSSTDRRDGWPAPKIGPTPDLETRALAVPRRALALL